MNQTTKSVPHGPKRFPLLGNLMAARRDILELLTTCRRDFGDIVELKFGPRTFVVLTDVDAIHHVLVTNHKNYVKSENYAALKLISGEGLFTSEGALWRRQRKLAQPAFHRESLDGFADVMARLTADSIEEWKRGKLSSIDMHEEMTRLTLRIAGMTLFSTDVDKDSKRVGEATAFVTHYVNDVVQSVVRFPLWVPTPNNRRFLQARDTLDEVVFRIIAERRTATGETPRDLLGMFMAAVGEGADDRMTDSQLRDEVMTALIAGHETTASLLSFTFLALCEHPEVAARVCEEVVRVFGDRVPTFEDLRKLEFTTRVIEETLRLYPPGWVLEKQALAEDTLCGCRIDPKTIIAISPYVLHRHPKYWQDPERFDPDRFLPERSQVRPKFAYLPFGGGPRICIGNAFAMMEVQIIVAMVARAFDFGKVSERVDLEAVLTLRPKGGLPMRVTERTSPLPV